MEWKLIYNVVVWFRDNWAKVRPWITPQALGQGTRPVPRRTFSIVLDTARPPLWHMGMVGSEPATQVSARYYVTNLSDERVLVVGCKLRPDGTRETYDLHRTVRQLQDEDERTATAFVSVYGFIRPPVVREGESFEAQIYMVDQFGNENPGPVTTFRQR